MGLMEIRFIARTMPERQRRQLSWFGSILGSNLLAMIDDFA
jgi:hypothetical protein